MVPLRRSRTAQSVPSKPRAENDLGKGPGRRWLVAATALLCAASGARGESDALSKLVWLQGCWELRAGARTVEECWMRPAGASMIGMSRTLVDGAFRGHEFLILRAVGDTLRYEANPSGQAPTVFVTTAWSDSLLVFENPGHDFPQRIGYRRAGADSIAAWIEGTIEGKARRVEFPYARVSCMP